MRRSLALSLFCLAAGCADQTAILVEVTSPDYTVPTEIDSLTIQAVSTFGSMLERTYPVGVSWPHSVTIVPASREEAVGWVDIEVTGNLRGVPVVSRTVRSEFVTGETRRVSVVLMRCVGAGCDPDAGMEDAGPRDVGVNDAGVDAGMDMPDVPTLDAPEIDGGGFDAGMDAGMDAGRDAGTDAGSDAGRDAPLPPGARLVINEVDYDQDSVDTAEFVEIHNAGASMASLTGIAVVLFDGSSGAEYGRAMLSGTLASGGYLVVGIAGQTLTVPPGVTRVDFATTTSLQNGPDGVAILDTTAMTVLDRFSYETPPVTTATIFGSMMSLVEGMAFTTADSTSARSLCRRPNGSDTNDAATDFMTCSVTLGAVN